MLRFIGKLKNGRAGIVRMSVAFLLIASTLDEAAISAVGEKHLVDRKSTRLNSSHSGEARMPSSA